MPTHSLLPFVESPDGLAQDLLVSNNASIPGPYSGMTPHTTFSEMAVLQSAGSTPLSCIFCDQTFAHQDELGPHVLSQHQTTFSDPAVLHVKAEFRIPGERPRAKVSSLPVENEEVHSCIVCGQISQDATELETHMRKHKDYFTYCCNVCGRRFREPWFLKNHMRMHGKSGSKSKSQQDPETPITVNGIVQDPAPEPVATLYKMCMVCGFFFPDHDRLAQHSKVHNREVEPVKDEDKENTDGTTDSVAKQETFLQCLGLLPRSAGNSLQHERSSKWIPELDPFKTYQAWQLATKGKVAVGPNTTKDIGQEAGTDNEECGSDKEESSNIWSGGQGDKATKEGLGRDVRPQQQTTAEHQRPQRRSLMQKHQDKERPTTCEECQRTFRTYHQLVLHSRVHKRDRGGEESPTSSEGKLSRAGSVEQAEEGTEEGLDEAALTGEDGSKVKSKECRYCGKSFRSSYYLTIHLRTHTGEKPYKCPYCDYAAAQKTSLKYHLERRHKDKPGTLIPSRPAPSEPSPTDEKHKNGAESHVRSVSKLWVPRVSAYTNGAPEDADDGKPDSPLVPMNIEDEKTVIKSANSLTDVVAKCPIPVHPKTEKEIKDENCEVPLNLSLKVSFPIAAGAQPRNALIPSACSICAFKTMYPEVLVIHRKLIHNVKSDVEKKDPFRGRLRPKRLSGCPPSLNGIDVDPLAINGPTLPRRTRSPSPPEERLEEHTPVGTPQGPARPPPRPTPPRSDVVHKAQQQRPNVIAHPSQESASRLNSVAPKPVVDRPAPPPDRVVVGERTQAVRNGAFWHSEAARLSLSSRLGSLPQVDFGETPTKRFKYSVPAAREAVDGPNRMLISVRGSKTSSPGSAQSAVSESFAASRATPTAMGPGLEAEWGMMNFLTSYMPTEVASYYHGAAINPNHAGLAAAIAGGRTVPYHHLPSLLNLQRRDASSLFPNQRYGTTDKST